MNDELLPGPDQAPRCSPFTRELGVHPAGTAIAADQVLVADVPLPWPMPIKSHPRLEGMMDVAGGGRVATRLLAGVPEHGGTGIRVMRFRRTGASAIRSVYRIGSDEELGPLIADLADDGDPAGMRIEGPDADFRTALVCTQGSHDVCCGTDGMRLVDDARAAFPGLEIIRVSHTGGHRFAPTAFTFPDGRMWGHLDLALLGGILDRSVDPAVAARHCRGWWGAGKGEPQAAEVALFGRFGWAFDAVDRELAVLDDADGVSTVVVTTEDLRLLVDVAVGREVPTISCRAPGGRPAKPGVEYTAIPRI